MPISASCAAAACASCALYQGTTHQCTARPPGRLAAERHGGGAHLLRGHITGRDPSDDPGGPRRARRPPAGATGCTPAGGGGTPLRARRRRRRRLLLLLLLPLPRLRLRLRRRPQLVLLLCDAKPPVYARVHIMPADCADRVSRRRSSNTPTRSIASSVWLGWCAKSVLGIPQGSPCLKRPTVPAAVGRRSLRHLGRPPVRGRAGPAQRVCRVRADARSDRGAGDDCRGAGAWQPHCSLAAAVAAQDAASAGGRCRCGAIASGSDGGARDDQQWADRCDPRTRPDLALPRAVLSSVACLAENSRPQAHWSIPLLKHRRRCQAPPTMPRGRWRTCHRRRTG